MLYLAAALEQKNHEVAVIDGILGPVLRLPEGKYLLGLNPEELADRIQQERPDIVGLSCPFTTRYKLFRETLAVLRRRLPDVPILGGGIHPTLLPEQVLRRNGLDALVLGEGEVTLVELVQRYQATGKIDPEGLDGVAWEHNGKIRVVPRKHYVENLDELPPPALHLVPVEEYMERSRRRYVSRTMRAFSVITSRSCPGRCSFCCIHSTMGPRWRAHSVERVIVEISRIMERWKPDIIAFEDDRLTFDRDRMVALCKGMIDKLPGIRWYTPNGIHIADLDEELLALMKESGCYSLNLAVESGDPYILNRVIGKKGNADRTRRVARTCQRLGIGTNAYFILGMPGETEQSIRRSLDFALELKLDQVGVLIATPFPGTRMFRECAQKGYLDPERFSEQFLESGDPDLLHQPLFETPTMTKDRLLWWQREFNRRFFSDLHRRKPVERFKDYARAIRRQIVG